MKKLDETLDLREIGLHRKDNCKHYEHCLNEASTKRWRSFSCLDCHKYEARVQMVPRLRKASNLAWQFFKMPAKHCIFVGFKIDESLQSKLDQCQDSDRVFFEDPTYLEIVNIDGSEYIGKSIEKDSKRDRIQDTSRSVVSLLSRIASGWENSYSQTSIIGYLEEQVQNGSAPIVEMS